MKNEFEVIEQVNQNLICAICQSPFYKPQRLTCGHAFCGKCIYKWVVIKLECPSCRTRTGFQLFQKDHILTNLSDEFLVRCLNCKTWEGKQMNFLGHRKTCEAKARQNKIIRQQQEASMKNFESEKLNYEKYEQEKVEKQRKHKLILLELQQGFQKIDVEFRQKYITDFTNYIKNEATQDEIFSDAKKQLQKKKKFFSKIAQQQHKLQSLIFENMNCPDFYDYIIRQQNEIYRWALLNK